jgi:hypothetical protein
MVKKGSRRWRRLYGGQKQKQQAKPAVSKHASKAKVGKRGGKT